MGENSKIEWTDHTFNPWRGCTKIADGCANCYAARSAKRNPGTLGIWGDEGTRVVAAADMWKQPLKWQREAKAAGVRRRVFCASLADVFEDWTGPIHNHFGEKLYKTADGWNPQQFRGTGERRQLLELTDVRAALLNLIDSTPDLDWLLLTKRPENVRKFWARKVEPRPGRNDAVDCVKFRGNVWLGTSVASQTDEANIAELLKCRDLAPVLFASYEPAIGPFDFRAIEYGGARFDSLTDTCCPFGRGGEGDQCNGPGCNGVSLDWIIVGGESGPHARPFNIVWAKSAIEQCKAAGVACFVKQLGAKPFEEYVPDPEDFRSFWSIKDPKGGDCKEWPRDLRVREFPKVQNA